MPERELQVDFSTRYSGTVFDRQGRRQKAEKIIAILRDHLGDLAGRTALDLGCSAGNTTIWFAGAFSRVVGVDIDRPALMRARRENAAPNVLYSLMNGERLALRDAAFDVVICAHVYEHVPDAQKLLAEIRRLLKPGGVCFFSAGNRLQWMEPHYRLPLLSVLPRRASNLYLRLTGRGSAYYEKHLTYWGLKRLAADFDVVDYTRRVVAEPERFAATDVLAPGSLRQRFSLFALRLAYWACPTYLWLLRRRERAGGPAPSEP